MPNEILLKIFEYIFDTNNKYPALLLNKKLTNIQFHIKKDFLLKNYCDLCYYYDANMYYKDNILFNKEIFLLCDECYNSHFNFKYNLKKLNLN